MFSHVLDIHKYADIVVAHDGLCGFEVHPGVKKEGWTQSCDANNAA